MKLWNVDNSNIVNDSYFFPSLIYKIICYNLSKYTNPKRLSFLVLAVHVEELARYLAHWVLSEYKDMTKISDLSHLYNNCGGNKLGYAVYSLKRNIVLELYHLLLLSPLLLAL